MKFFTSLLAFALILSVLGTEAFQRRSAPTVTEITYERTECFGACPAYKIILHPDGTLTYTGKAHVERLGTFIGTGDSGNFRHTVELIRTSHFDQFKERYGNAPTDVPLGITTVVIGDKRQTIIADDRSVPTALWAIELVIEAQANKVSDWKKVIPIKP